MKLGAIVIPTSRELGEISARDRGMFPVQLEGYLTHPENQSEAISDAQGASFKLENTRRTYVVSKTTKGGCQCLSGTPDILARHIVVCILSPFVKTDQATNYPAIIAFPPSFISSKFLAQTGDAPTCEGLHQAHVQYTPHAPIAQYTNVTVTSLRESA